MGKWYGAIGYTETIETSPGVWQEQITEKHYAGDISKNNRRLQSTSQLNDDIQISNEISIISDPYVSSNFHAIRYVTFMGAKWKVANIDVQYPRLILSLGGVYNAE